MTEDPFIPDGSARLAAIELGERILRDRGGIGPSQRPHEWKTHRNSAVWIVPPYGATPGIVIKIGRGWDAHCVQSIRDGTALALEHLNRSALADALVIPAVIASLEVPAVVCMEYLDGSDGADAVRRLCLRGDEHAVRGLLEFVFRWGRGLAAYHEATRTGLTPSDNADAARHAKRVARLFGLSWPKARALLRDDDVVHSFVDVGLHNVRFVSDGRVGFLDFPYERIPRYRHDDVAAALAWLDDAYRDARFGVRGRLRRLLSAAFLDGYRALVPAIATSPSRWWIGAYLAWAQMQWARTAVKRRHVLHAGSSCSRMVTCVVSSHLGLLGG